MAEQKVVELKVTTNATQATKVLTDIKNGVKDAKTEVTNLNQTLNETGEKSSAFDAIKKGAFELIPGLKGATEASNGLLLKLYQLVANPIGLVITAIVVALKFLYEAFQSSIAGGKELKAIFAGLEGVMAQAKDAVFGLGRAFIDLVAAGYKFITLDFEGAMESFNDATKEAKTSMKQLGDATSTTYKAFYELEKAQQKNDKARKIAAVEESKNNKLLVQSRDILTDETASLKEKQKALSEVTKSEVAASAERIRIAKEDLRIITERQKTLGGEAGKKMMQQVRDAQIALNEAEAEGARNGIKLNRQRKMLNRQANSDEKEAQAERDRIKKEAEAARLEADKVNREAEIALLDERNKELQTRIDKYNSDRAKLVKAGYKDFSKIDEAFLKDRASINKKYDDELLRKQKELDAQKLEFAKSVSDQLQKVLDKEFEDYDKNLKKKTDANLADANNEALSFKARLDAVTAREAQMKNVYFQSEEERTAFEKANSDARKKIARDEASAKREAAMAVADTLANVANLLGKETEEGKALAVASATISTVLSAQKAYESTIGIPYVGPFLAPINAGLALASGYKNIQSIIATQVPGGGGGGGASSNLPSAPQAPSFNVVGNSGVTSNQIAKTTQSQAPIKAYVVSKDVTTQQALDRNIVKSATLG
jgi:hypothetical protein